MILRRVLPVVLVLWGASSIAAMASDWTVAIEKLEKSVMQISDNCSAFAIDDNRDYALTAKHCTSEDITKPTVVDLIPSKVIADDVQYDLAVLHVPGMDHKALKLAEKEPHAGVEVGALGFGMGLKKWMFRHTWVSNRDVSIPDLDGDWVIFDSPFVGGQSGSPVVNFDGEVVAIVQMTTRSVGIGRGADRIRSRVGKYFAPAQP